MSTCPFCHLEKENVERRKVSVPIPGAIRSIFATSKEAMCDDCFNKMEEAFKNQGDDITKDV